MNIAGIEKVSFIDYPGKASTVVFLGGCNFRCGYCHNPSVVHCSEEQVSRQDFFSFLEKRRRFLDAVCVSGGEPTLHDGLGSFIAEIKDLGYLVKLDTNGSRPEVLRQLLREKLLDYVAMDVKGPFAKYGSIVNAPVEPEAVKRSMEILAASGIGFEFRTTVTREQLSKEDLLTMAEEIFLILSKHGHSHIRSQGREIKWYLQTFRNSGMLLSDTDSYSAYSSEEMEKLKEYIEHTKVGTENDRLCVSVR